MDRISDGSHGVNKDRPIQLITLSEEERGWRWMRLTPGATHVSREMWTTHPDAMAAAITVADCYDCPFVERFPMALSAETFQLITSGDLL